MPTFNFPQRSGRQETLSALHLYEVRCPCGALLFKAKPPISLLEIKCRRCGATFNTRP